jgi:hypothetical protein
MHHQFLHATTISTTSGFVSVTVALSLLIFLIILCAFIYITFSPPSPTLLPNLLFSNNPDCSSPFPRTPHNPLSRLLFVLLVFLRRLVSQFSFMLLGVLPLLPCHVRAHKNLFPYISFPRQPSCICQRLFLCFCVWNCYDHWSWSLILPPFSGSVCLQFQVVVLHADFFHQFFHFLQVFFLSLISVL